MNTLICYINIDMILNIILKKELFLWKRNLESEF